MTDETTRVRSALTWFEIPALDFDRALAFYQTIFETSLHEERFGPGRIAVFAHDQAGVGGCIDERSESKPGDLGPVIYLGADGRLDRTLALVEGAGGRIAVPKTALPPGMGFVAHVIDTEGNRIGLHAIS